MLFSFEQAFVGRDDRNTSLPKNTCMGGKSTVDLVLIQTGSGKSLEILDLKIGTNCCTNLPALTCKSCCSYAN